MTEVSQKSQEAIGPWNRLATDSIDQGNPPETDLGQGGQLAIGSEQISKYSLVNSSEQGLNFFLSSLARGNHGYLDGRQQVSSLHSTTGGDYTEDEDEEILWLQLATLEIRIKLKRLKQKKLKRA